MVQTLIQLCKPTVDVSNFVNKTVDVFVETYSRLRVETPKETPDANLVKNT